MLLALAVTACGDAYQTDPLYAALADSSAAGYDVGPGSADVPWRRPAAESSSSSTARSPNAGSRPRAGAAAASAANTARTGSGDPPGTERPTDTARAVSRSDSAAHADATIGRDIVRLPGDTGRRVAHAGDSVRAPGDSAALPSGHTVVGDDSIAVNAFLTYGPAARVVWLDLVAGFDGSNGSLNFNGGFEGAHTLVVPLGWRIEMRFHNRDRELSHSAIVVRAVDPIPMIAPPAAFPNAFTLALEEGLIEGRSDVVRFSADTDGRYAILCAVPGHGQSGMWVRLRVDRNARAPEYRRR